MTIKNFIKINIFLLTYFITFLSYAQCFECDLQSEPPFYLNKLDTTKEEQEIKDFFNLKIEFWEFSNVDRFCYQQNEDRAIKITIGQSIVNDSLVKTPIYAHLLAYHFQKKYNIKTSSKEKELQADLLAGYYYCYQNITKKWDNIMSNVIVRINKAKELNIVMNTYIKLYNNYQNNNNNDYISLVERKEAFLKGTYYAMPPSYRMQINSNIDFGNNVELLFNEVQKKEINNNDLQPKEINNKSFDELKFVIRKTIKL